VEWLKMVAGTKTLVVLSALLALAAGYDKYADALAKYKMWQEKYGGGSVRTQRQTNRRTDIFVPHRPLEGGRQFSVNDVLAKTNLEAEQTDVGTENLVRGVRNPETNIIQTSAGISDYVSGNGVPLYKLRKRYPLGYGRKRRSAEPQGWSILDPLTGRPLQHSNVDLTGSPVIRNQRQPEQNGEQTLDLALRHFTDTFGEKQPIYKYYKKYPYYG